MGTHPNTQLIMVNKDKTPKLIKGFFKWICKESLFEELQGDLAENHINNTSKFSKEKANRIYFFEIIKLIRPSVLKSPKPIRIVQLELLFSHLKVAGRNILRHKTFSFINLFGLSVAMSAGLLVIGMITDLLKFDEFQEHKEDTYRVISSVYFNGNNYDQRATSPLALGDQLKEMVPGIQITQLGRNLRGTVTANDKQVSINGIYADENFFDFLSFELLQGSEASALMDPFSAVISEEFSDKVFPNENPIGKTISLENIGTFNIKGIVKNPPKFSHIQFDVIASLSTYHSLANQSRVNSNYSDWGNLDNFYNYIRIPENQQKQQVNTWLENNTLNYYKNPEEFYATFELQQITSIVPGKDLSDQIGPKMIMLPIIILSGVAVMILLSALFNYTNLSMARAFGRAREVGMRKLNGASNRSIYSQFTIEAVFLACLSLFLGICLFIAIRPGFLEIVPRASEMLSLELSPKLILLFLVFAIGTGIIAGAAPSIFFSRLCSLKAMAGAKGLKTLSKLNFRKGLIITQFALSSIFILAIIIIIKQYNFSVNYDLGFNKDNILNITLKGTDPEILKSELTKLPEVESVSFSNFLPGVGSKHYALSVDPRNGDSILISNMVIDESFLNNFEIGIVAGNNFEKGQNLHDEQVMLVNQRFAKYFEYNNPADIIGETFLVEGKNVAVAGVINDFIACNLEDRIAPMMFRKLDDYQFANVKLKSTDHLSSIHVIEKKWNELNENDQMYAQLMSDHIAGYYVFLIDMMKLFGYVGFMAITISCLGLFGMTIYTTEIRMKEIGIRKTFGATSKELVLLLSKGFVKMAFWSVLFGLPVSYFFFDLVILAQHHYRPEISVFDMLLSFIILLSFCLISIIVQTWNASRVNPTNILRNE